MPDIANSMLLSVITPTYNRAHTLSRVWKSLTRQQSMRFEWIVMDDGSTDDTGKLVNNWKATDEFRLIYERVPHGGRNAAVNAAKKHISGRFVTVMDSDDCFKDDAFQTIRKFLALHEIGSEEKIGGLAFPYEDEKGTRLCSPFPHRSFRCSYLDCFHKYRIRGEILYVWKRDYFKNVIYSERPPPEHIAESTAHAPLSRAYEFLYLDYVVGQRYRRDGIDRLTRSDKHRLKPSMVRYIECYSILRDRIEYFNTDRGWFFRNATNMIAYGCLSNCGVYEQFASLPSGRAKLLWTTALPVGMLKLLSLKLRFREF